MGVTVVPRAGAAAPNESDLRRRMEQEGLHPYMWSNGPYDQHAAHSHDYDKVIYVVRGTITFGLPDEGRSLPLQAGDRLDLPAGTVHDAQAGSEGVACLEAHSGKDP